MVASTPGSLREVLGWLQANFCPSATRDVRVAYQLDLSGAQPGRIWIEIRNGQLELGEGQAGVPDVTFELSSEDLFAVLGGQENPDLLFMADRLSIRGELSQALKLRSYFPRPA